MLAALQTNFSRPGKPSVLSGGAHAVAEHCPHHGGGSSTAVARHVWNDGG